MTRGTTVRFATGAEWFTDLGSGARENPEDGEVIFVDEAGLVSARRWCWRQAAESAAGPETTEILVTVEGHHDGAPGDVAEAVADLEELIGAYAGPRVMVSGMVSPSTPVFEGLASA